MIAIVDYGVGNLFSLKSSLNRIGAEAVVSGDGETREIRAEVYASVSEETVRRAVGELNLRLPVYKRIGTVTTRSDPFPRTASGKIKYS